jgi:hypothetical protein
MLVWDGKKITLEGVAVPQRYLFLDEAREAKGEFVHPNMNIALDLHAASITIESGRENPNQYHLIFTPVAVSNRTPDDFRKVLDYQVLSNLQFTQSFNLLDRRQVISAFLKALTSVEELVKMQESACAGAGQAAQPVAVVIGKRKSADINTAALYRQIIGASCSSKSPPPDMSEISAMLEDNPDLLKAAAYQYLTTGTRAVKECVDYLFQNRLLEDPANSGVLERFNSSRIFFEAEKLRVDDFKCKETLLQKCTSAIGRYSQRVGDPFFDTVEFLLVPEEAPVYRNSVAIDSAYLKTSERREIERIAYAVIYAVCLEYKQSGVVGDLTPQQRIDFALQSTDSKLTSQFVRKAVRMFGRACVFAEQDSAIAAASADCDDAPDLLATLERVSSIVTKVILRRGDFSHAEGIPDFAKAVIAAQAEKEARKLISSPGRYYELLDEVNIVASSIAVSSRVEKGAFQYFCRTNYDESREVRDRFNEAFRLHRKGNFNQWVKQGLDEPAPFFVDPLLWMVADLHDVMYGTRHPEDVPDRRDWKKNVVESINSIRKARI